MKKLTKAAPVQPIVFAVSFVMLLQCSAPAREWRFPSSCFDGDYISTVTQAECNSSPAWNAKQPNPPLSARKAIIRAETALHKLWKPEVDREVKYVFEGAALAPLEKEK